MQKTEHTKRNFSIQQTIMYLLTGIFAGRTLIFQLEIKKTAIRHQYERSYTKQSHKTENTTATDEIKLAESKPIQCEFFFSCILKIAHDSVESMRSMMMTVLHVQNVCV